MSFVPDLRAISGQALRAVSDGAIDQLAGRFAGLPRPLLAAIGAGDLAVEHLALLREMAREQVTGIPLDGEEVVAAAAGVAASVQSFAGELPGRLQGLAAELPGRVAALTRVTGDLDPAALRETLEAYTDAAGVIYGGLARRGDRIWSDVRAASSRPGTVVEATPDRGAGTVRAVPSAVADGPSAVRPVTKRATGPNAAGSRVATAATTRTPAKATTTRTPAATTRTPAKAATTRTPAATTRNPAQAGAGTGTRGKTTKQAGTNKAGTGKAGTGKPAPRTAAPPPHRAPSS